jgi:hypothetical protein
MCGIMSLDAIAGHPYNKKPRVTPVRASLARVKTSFADWCFHPFFIILLSPLPTFRAPGLHLPAHFKHNHLGHIIFSTIESIKPIWLVFADCVNRQEQNNRREASQR